MIEHPDEWKNEYLIYLSIQDIEDLYKWASKMEEKNKKYSIFFEPDIGNEPTRQTVQKVEVILNYRDTSVSQTLSR